MATYRGMDGSFTYATNIVGELNAWTVNSNVEVMDSSSFGTAWRKFVGGIAQWGGSATGNFDYGDTLGQKAITDKLTIPIPLGAAIAMEFLVGTGKKFTGTGVVTTINWTAGLGALITVDFQFQGSGALAITWA